MRFKLFCGILYLFMTCGCCKIDLFATALREIGKKQSGSSLCFHEAFVYPQHEEKTMAVLQQTFIFLILMGVGVYARRIGIITPENQGNLSSLVFSIAYPAIILSGAVNSEEHIATAELMLSFAAAAALLLASMILALILAILLRYERKFWGIINVMVVFTNIGFMGVPMIDGLYGRSALIYITFFLIPFNLLFYSYAVMAIRGFKGQS